MEDVKSLSLRNCPPYQIRIFTFYLPPAPSLKMTVCYPSHWIPKVYLCVCVRVCVKGGEKSHHSQIALVENSVLENQLLHIQLKNSLAKMMWYVQSHLKYTQL